MKQKLMVKYTFISTLLAAAALCLLGLPFDRVNAGPPEPTPNPAMDISTSLQPYQTPDAELSQSDGRLLEKAPSPSEVMESPLGVLDQHTSYAIADAVVLEGYPSQNLGDTADMWAGYDEYLEPDGETARSLVRFDIASLPPNQDISEATLRLYLVGSWDYPGTSRTIRTYRITSSWSESSVTWNNRPGYGGSYGSNSIVHGAWGWYEFDVTNLVRAWYDETYTNHGIMLRGPEVSGLDASWRSFSTREGSYRPRLVIEYTASTPTLTPTNTSTPTPTPTNTPTPTTPPPSGPTVEWKIYLPGAMNSWSPPTATPTPTPTPIPAPPPTSDLPCLYVVNWWRDYSPPYGIIRSTYHPPCLMATYVDADYIFDGIGRQTGYRATIERQGKPDFDMDVTYIFNSSGGVIGADVTKTYVGGYEYQMEITKFCPTTGQLTGYKVNYNGQEVTIGSCP